MEVFRDSKSLKAYIKRCKEKNQSIGFAPTMGNIHLGHISLLKYAKKENDIAISSIFVNPTQFNNTKDLEKYPRTEEEDLQKFSSEKIDAVYIPRNQDIYPHGVKTKEYDFEGLDDEMEGKFRPKHFLGVATVVEELFRQVQPDNAYFGEKDFQQLRIVKKLVEKSGLPTKIKPVPTYRENNGLAMSSRNNLLTKTEREAGKIIYETLSRVAEWIREKDMNKISEMVSHIFEKSIFSLEYFVIANEETLKSAYSLNPKDKYRVFIAVFCRNVRLIDNMPIR